MLSRSPSEVVTVTTYEGSICSLSEGGVGVIGIIRYLLERITGMFTRVMCWCVRGAACFGLAL